MIIICFCKQPNNQTCYQYIPTPIKELDKRRQLEEEEGIHIVDAAAAPLEDISADDVITHNLEAVTDKNVPKEKDDHQSKHFFPFQIREISLRVSNNNMAHYYISPLALPLSNG